MLNEHHRRIPYINGIETIDYYQREYSSIPFIGLSSFSNFDLAYSS